ncbi:hypothetical protein GYMLUDRAFT_249856 [Collybiopsis luxurians FD-317 M1]|uniref:F-box domain-containing protein n=1 Tax=Collybiopsis luxurians FD-317 M1 TaxID=944289 RepID=A0A0D0C848_9AGAR|nr:hypothetical protein GYMLUDRAFT_249856 [Collybiopsis luxurians FD-317 M1]
MPESSRTDGLRSEHGPAVTDTKQIEDALDSVDKDIAEYESEILLLQSRIVYIKTHQKRLREHSAKLRSLRSPIRRLPNEVLSPIFNFFCDRNLLQEYPWSKDFDFQPPTDVSMNALTYLPAMTISSVCSRWRSLALSLPQIWSRVTLELSPENSRLPDVSRILSGFLATLELHLQRSKDCPLTLNIHIPGSHDLDDNIVPDRLLALDAVCCNPWCVFSWRGPQLLSNIPVPFFAHSALEELILLQTDPLSLKYFERAPNLHTFRGRCISSHSLPIPPMATLSDVLLPCDFGEIGRVLDVFPNVRTLCLVECSAEASLLSISTSPRLSNTITELQLFPQGSFSLTMLETTLSSFIFPSLICLAIIGLTSEPYTGPWPRVALETFLQRSSCNLTTFRIDTIGVCDWEFVAVLKLLPSLTDLEVNDIGLPIGQISPITPRVVRSLHGFITSDLHTSTSPLLPNLTGLKIQFGGTAFDDGTFVDMVSSRWLPDSESTSDLGLSCLRSVTLRFKKRSMDGEAYRPLEYLDKAGMRVAIIGSKQGR